MTDFSTPRNVNFNLKMNLKNPDDIENIASLLQKKLPDMALEPSSNYHVTFGQTNYYVNPSKTKKGLEAIKKMPPKDTIKDYDNICASLNQELDSKNIPYLNPRSIVGFRITEESGYVIMQLKSNKKILAIAQSFTDASNTAKSKSKHEKHLDLTSHYMNTDKFDLHVTLGKIDNYSTISDNEKLVYTQKLNQFYNKDQNVELLKNTKVKIGKEGVLTSAFMHQKQRQIIKKNAVQFVKSNAAASNKTLAQSQNTNISSSTTVSSPTAAEIKEAINIFFPLNERNSIKAINIMPSDKTKSGYNEISFNDEDDQLNFCEKFRKFRDLQGGGSCHYSKTSDLDLLMSDRAINTLISLSENSMSKIQKLSSKSSISTNAPHATSNKKTSQNNTNESSGTKSPIRISEIKEALNIVFPLDERDSNYSVDIWPENESTDEWYGIAFGSVKDRDKFYGKFIPLSDGKECNKDYYFDDRIYMAPKAIKTLIALSKDNTAEIHPTSTPKNKSSYTPHAASSKMHTPSQNTNESSSTTPSSKILEIKESIDNYFKVFDEKRKVSFEIIPHTQSDNSESYQINFESKKDSADFHKEFSKDLRSDQKCIISKNDKKSILMNESALDWLLEANQVLIHNVLNKPAMTFRKYGDEIDSSLPQRKHIKPILTVTSDELRYGVTQTQSQTSSQNTNLSSSTIILPTVPEIKEAIDVFFPTAGRHTKNIGVILPGKSASGLYEITFMDKNDKINFCNKFKNHEGKRGQCNFSNHNEKHAWMDETAIQTLIENNTPKNKKSFKT